MYKIKNKAESMEILCYDEIGFGGLTAQQVIMQLKGEPSVRNIDIRISSAGGDLGEAIGIYNYLKNQPATKTVYIDGIAYSAASIIAMSGDKIVMPETALMMIHNPWTYCEGNADDMRDTAESLDKWRDICAKIYMNRTGKSYEEIIEMMNAGKEMNGVEAKEKGFVDEVSGVVKDSVKDAYEAGVQSERSRLKALDELMTPRRSEIIMRAKYETYAKAEDIALELLKKEQYQEQRYQAMKKDAETLSEISMNVTGQAEIERGIKMMNRMRGYAE